MWKKKVTTGEAKGKVMSSCSKETDDEELL